MRKYIIFLLLLILSTIIQCKKTTATKGEEQKEYLVASGTFIQDFLVYNWDDAKWQQELSVLKEVKMKYIVFYASVYNNQSLYESELPGITSKYNVDVLDRCLRNAERAGMKVFIGLNFHEDWWQPYTSSWLYEQMNIGNQIASEIKEKYSEKYKNSFYGWYWAWEIDNLNYKTQSKQDMLVNALNSNLNHLRSITPDMPVMLCPFMNYRLGSASEYSKMWTYIFSKTNFKAGDVFAPQDCIGADGLKIEMLDSWFYHLSKAVETKPGLLFWSDAETFVQSNWSPAPIERFVEQMKIVQPYVSGIITFAYSHYYSPVTVSGDYHQRYKNYLKTGKL
ncbi:DUF4434 domain-containing protein [Pseudopedobacter beijingensis]|uniref:DUF4434 domain-containing protein n=1 Tax=Pseudopedobacter beijingensis TaxID=1207056 RepID=A0ABW4IBQ6_9SPHI